MPFLVITQAQELIRGAGGPYKAGDRLKRYWMTVCENLALYADVWVQPRTIEALWKEGRGGQELLNALRKAAAKRIEAETIKVNEHDAKFIADLRATFEVLKKDKLVPRHEIAILGGVISLMDSISRERAQLEAAHQAFSDRVCLLRNCCQVARALLREEQEEVTAIPPAAE